MAPSNGNSGLTPRQHKALAALLSEPTITTAAAASGIGERTLFTWLAEPAFAEAYRAARREAMSQATANLQRAAGAAVRTLESVMNDAGEKGATRVAAARAILDAALRAVELEDLAERIEALEAALEAKQ